MKGERGRRDPPEGATGPSLMPQTGELESSRVHLVHVTYEEDNNSVHFRIHLEYNIKQLNA